MDLAPVLADLPCAARRARAVDLALRAHAAHSSTLSPSVEDLVPCGCLVTMAAAYWLDPSRAPLPALDDEEGTTVPTSLPPITDGHVHVFPDPVFEALWRWFEAYGWSIRYKLRAPEVIRYLLDRGIARLITLHYAHKPGMARALNSYVAELVRAEPRVVGFGTVLPGEPDALAVLDEIRALGLRGVKLHCHVQAFAPDSPEALAVFERCAELDLPVLIHAGREPKSPAYRFDPYTFCSADRVERVLTALPRLRLSIPHFGADEIAAYGRLLDRHENLFLDTTMCLASYFAMEIPVDLLKAHASRILFGTDFPNLPYAWDRELRALTGLGLSSAALEAVLGGAADAFLG
ncbi:MAG: amidohydrolase family protein [Polyangiaceae bacterium]